MSTLQEQPTPALVIHRHGSRQYCVLPAGVDPNGDVAREQYLLISSRKACEAFVRERLALAEAQATASPAQNGQASPEDPESYAARVRQAYRELTDERRSPDVPIVALFERVDGGLGQLHSFLGKEAYEGRCAPSAGEMTLADEAAKRSALTLPGEVDRITGKPLQFLNVKLLEAPEQAREVAPDPEPETAKGPEKQYAVTLTASELELLTRAIDDRCRSLAASKVPDQVPQLQKATDLSAKLEGLQAVQAVKPQEPAREPKVQPEPKVQQPELAEHESYRKELVARARAAYPNADPQLAGRIDKEINRRVEIVRTYEAHLQKAAADSFPHATPAEKAKHQANIKAEIAEYRQALEKDLQQKREQRQQQQQAPPRARQQGHERGICR